MAITTGLYAQSITLQHNLPMNGGLVDCSTLVGQQTFQISYTATAPPTSWYGLLSNIFSSCDHDGATFVVRLENMATGNTFTHSFGGDPNNPIHGNQFSGVFNVPISPDNNAYRLSTFSNGSTSTGAYCDIAEENLFIFWTILEPSEPELINMTNGLHCSDDPVLLNTNKDPAGGCVESYTVSIYGVDQNWSWQTQTLEFSQQIFSTPPNQINLSNLYNFQLDHNYRVHYQLNDWIGWWENLPFRESIDIGLTTPNPEVCEGNTVTITGTDNATLWPLSTADFQWSKPSDPSYLEFGPSITVSPTQTETYVLSHANACAVDHEFTLQLNPLPQIDLSANATTLCSASTPVQLQASVTPNNNVGAWATTCAVDPSGQFDPIGNGCTFTGTSHNYAAVYNYTTAEGCVNSESITITVNQSPELNLSTTNPSCSGWIDGGGTVAPAGAGPFSVVWRDQGFSIGTQNSISGLGAGNYTVEAIDANTCVTLESFTLAEPDPLAASYTSLTDAPCAHTFNHTGTGSISITGGTAPYSRRINSGSWAPVTSNPFTRPDFAQQNISLEIEDANGCTYTTSYDVDAEVNLLLSTSTNPATCNGINNGAFNVFPITVPGGSNFSSMEQWSNRLGLKQFGWGHVHGYRYRKCQQLFCHCKR